MLCELMMITLLFQCDLLMGELSFLHNAGLNRNNLLVSAEGVITTLISTVGADKN